VVTDPDNFLNWLAEQFKNKYLSHAYRNVVLHASIIEAVLTNETSTNSFSIANRMLLCSKKISPDEFCLFDKVRKDRNKLVHKSFGLSQSNIGKIQKSLKINIHNAYKKSGFLESHLFKKYSLKRADCILFERTG
jgi:hypothetical protein